MIDNLSQKFNLVIISTAVLMIVSGAQASVTAQQSAAKTSSDAAASTTLTIASKAAAKPKTIEIKKSNPVEESNATSKVLTKIVLQIGKNTEPPLVTVAVGQVTTVILPEPVLQFKTYSDGLHIGESVANQKFHHIYIVPTIADIERNFVIEIASGLIELDLQSVSWNEKKGTAFTRHVEVLKDPKENNSIALAAENSNLKKELGEKTREIAGLNDRLIIAANAARADELRATAALLFKLTKTRNLRDTTSESKDWQITLTQETRDGKNRLWRIFEIENRGQQPQTLLEIKGEQSAVTNWFAENKEITSQGISFAPKQKIKMAVLETDAEVKPRNLLFIAEREVVKF